MTRAMFCRLMVTGNVVLMVISSAANAGTDVSLSFTNATNTTPTTIMVRMEVRPAGGLVGTTIMAAAIIPPHATAQQKRDLIKGQLQLVLPPADVTDIGASGVKAHLSTAANETVTARFDPGQSGEVADQVVSVRSTAGTAAFAGHFDPFDTGHQPAIFTAGIVTDVGELSISISAQDLNFQTDGPIICQALFQRLAPRAPQYGAQINYAGDRLEVYFDPAYTVTQGGVIFGTTSPSQGCAGQVFAPPPLMPGDMNCDGIVDFQDINAFVMAMSDPWSYRLAYPDCDIMNGDCNGDGYVDFGDINPFIGILSGG